MNEKLSAVKTFFKRVWAKVTETAKIVWPKLITFAKFVFEKLCIFLHFVWTNLKKAYAFLAPKVVSAAKFIYKKLSSFIKEAFKDKQKLILAVILIIAMFFTCIAVVRAVKGVVNGVAGIFASDETSKDANEIDKASTLPEEVISASEEAVAP